MTKAFRSALPPTDVRTVLPRVIVCAGAAVLKLPPMRIEPFGSTARPPSAIGMVPLEAIEVAQSHEPLLEMRATARLRPLLPPARVSVVEPTVSDVLP